MNQQGALSISKGKYCKNGSKEPKTGSKGPQRSSEEPSMGKEAAQTCQGLVFACDKFELSPCPGGAPLSQCGALQSPFWAPFIPFRGFSLSPISEIF